MNARYTPHELQIGIDVGSLNHAIAISNEQGNIIKKFEISHSNKGFDNFFQIVDKLSTEHHANINVAMDCKV
jgi:predicted NBD/HSP70 family sugar kinase